MLTPEEIVKGAKPIDWDDDAIKSVFYNQCQCGGKYRLVNFHRNPHLSRDEIDRIRAMLEGQLGSEKTYDVLEAQCIRCSNIRFFSFEPCKIHTDINELILQNQQFIRT